MAGQEYPAVGSDEHRGRNSGWRDDPIKTVDQGRLRRAPFAKHAAQLIGENHSAESSVVYGLEGPWGSGKSSVIALITTFLSERDDSRWRVVPFTPWATNGTEGLLAEFFAVLSTVAPQAESDRRLRDRITAYADVARPIAAAIPVVGAAIAEASRTIEGRLRKPWNVAFTEVAEELLRLDTPILVVVDDIDRLQPSELLDLLKVVRLLGRFPGVDFLLAYDEQTLIETLQDPVRGRVSISRARSFMEKIVQYPLSMPPLLTGKVVKMLDAGLTEIVTPERVESGFDRNRFGRIVLTTMPSQLTTPRAIERLQVWKKQLTRGSVGCIGLSRLDDPEPEWGDLLGAIEDDRDRRDARALAQAATGNGEDLRALLLAEDEDEVTLALSKIRVRYSGLMTRVAVLTDEMWARIEPLLRPHAAPGRPV